MDPAFNNTYRASELVKTLQELISRHGDLPVVAKDPDTGWRMEIGIVHKSVKPKEQYPEHLEIRTDYHSRPQGARSTLPNVV